MDFIPYKPQHFIDLVPKANVNDTGKEFAFVAEHHGKYPASTALVENEVIACFGITPTWTGVAYVWTLFSHDAEKHGMAIYRNTRAFLDSMMDTHHRLQCEVLTTNEQAIRFVEKFGFEREGRLRQVGPDKQDYFMYARLRHGE